MTLLSKGFLKSSTDDSVYDFHWEYTEEPHRSRRNEILKKYPEIKKLMKANGDPSLVLTGIAVAIVHTLVGLSCEYLGKPWTIWLPAFVGTWLASYLSFLMHEAVHNHVFGPNHVRKNRLFGQCLNTFMGSEAYFMFKKRHSNHHKFKGDEILDSEYPTRLEARLFSGSSSFTKWCWQHINPFVFLFRWPVLIHEKDQKQPWDWRIDEMWSILTVHSFYALLMWYEYTDLCGYFLLSNMFAAQTNLFGFWGVTSHVEYLPGKDNSSYYGWMNRIYLNFGYHVEHHDFPNIPAHYLPAVKQIAAEFYEDHFEFDSYYVAAIKFLFDPKLGVHSRLKRRRIAID